ncbi:hypothetical protein EMCRGX_G023360 [Ephydatia muelleri]
MSSELHVDQDYDKFDAWVYIKEYYGKLDCWHRNPLKYLHDFYTSHFQRGANLKVLNYGCGPIVAFEASAVPYAQEIVLAEYVEQNRAVAKLWLDKDPSRPDFSALYRYVVEELEGRGPGEVEERQDAVRHLSTICSCDIYQDPLIQKGYEGPYDVIYTASCIEDACSTIEVFGAALSKLCDLLKPGGWLVMSVCTGTEANTLNINYVNSIRIPSAAIQSTMPANSDGCRGVWQPQTVALFDVRTDVTSHSKGVVTAILTSAEEEKKKKYSEAAALHRASFTPLVVSLDGVLGREANVIVKHLAEKLAHNYAPCSHHFDLSATEFLALRYNRPCQPIATDVAEEEKKKKYSEAAALHRAYFTPLVVSVDGVLGREANVIVKHLAEKLAHNRPANSAILEAAEDNPGNTRLMHHVVVGLTWLKKRLAALGLKRRNVVETRLTLVHQAIKNELQTSNCCLGYRAMWRLLQLKYRYTI